MNRLNVLIFPGDVSPELTFLVRGAGIKNVLGASFSTIKNDSLHRFIRSYRPKVVLINGTIQMYDLSFCVQNIQNWIAMYDMDTVVYFLGTENIPGVIRIDTLDEIKELYAMIAENKTGQ